ncbi:hypothetical protein [Methylobacterium radiodurans]|uniref:hypothetical protein n=1 Tax=Methylobacterium radiodurans TaxID=2202828 RepID=UPI0013A5B253|nr:hypothetical protein [Methylobacterium radiodurans]
MSEAPSPTPLAADEVDLRAAFARLCAAEPASEAAGEPYGQALGRALGRCFGRPALALRGITPADPERTPDAG